MTKTVSMCFLACIGLFTVISSGCSLCCAPYDYCGPVYADGRCSNLARFRCGTAFNQTYNAPQDGVVLDENGQPIPGQNPQMQQTVPSQAAPSSVQPQPTPAQNLTPVPTASATQNRGNYAQRSYRTASTSAPNEVATALPVSDTVQTQTSAPIPQIPQSGTIAVNPDGYQKVAVYDENQQLMGYEMIDATGKSVQELPAPAHVQ